MSENNALFGKPWSPKGTFSSYDEADSARKTLAEDSSLQVKVRRSADGSFRVLVRSAVAEDVKRPKSKKTKATDSADKRMTKRQSREEAKARREKKQGRKK